MMQERRITYADNISNMSMPEIRARQKEIIARQSFLSRYVRLDEDAPDFISENARNTEMTQLDHELDLLDYKLFQDKLIERKGELDRHTERRIIIGIASIGQTLLMGMLFTFGVKAFEAYAAATLHLSVGGVAIASQAAVAVGSSYSAMYASLGLFQTIGISMGLLLLGALALKACLSHKNVNILTILDWIGQKFHVGFLETEPFNAAKAPKELRQFYKMVTIMDTPIPFKAMQHKLSDQVDRQLNKNLEFPGGEVYDRPPEDEAKWSVNRILNIVCGFGAPLCFALMPYWGGALLAFKIVIMLGITISTLPAILTLSLSILLQGTTSVYHEHQDSQIQRGLSEDLSPGLSGLRASNRGMIEGITDDLRTSLGQTCLEQLNQIYSTRGCKMLDERYRAELKAKFEQSPEGGEAAVHELNEIDEKMRFQKEQQKGRESMHAVNAVIVGAVDLSGGTDNPIRALSPVWSSEDGSVSPTRNAAFLNLDKRVAGIKAADPTFDLDAPGNVSSSENLAGRINFDTDDPASARNFVGRSSTMSFNWKRDSATTANPLLLQSSDQKMLSGFEATSNPLSRPFDQKSPVTHAWLKTPRGAQPPQIKVNRHQTHQDTSRKLQQSQPSGEGPFRANL
jgi:hypothetical protein